jgi:hypothetical protein
LWNSCAGLCVVKSQYRCKHVLINLVDKRMLEKLVFTAFTCVECVFCTTVSTYSMDRDSVQTIRLGCAQYASSDNMFVVWQSGVE